MKTLLTKDAYEVFGFKKSFLNAIVKAKPEFELERIVCSRNEFFDRDADTHGYWHSDEEPETVTFRIAGFDWFGDKNVFIVQDIFGFSMYHWDRGMSEKAAEHADALEAAIQLLKNSDYIFQLFHWKDIKSRIEHKLKNELSYQQLTLFPDHINEITDTVQHELNRNVQDHEYELSIHSIDQLIYVELDHLTTHG